MRRLLAVLVLMVAAACLVAPAADARSACRAVHGSQFCKAKEHRHALRVIRRQQVWHVKRTHVKFHRSYYRGWDVRRLEDATDWERSRLQHLKSLPTFYPDDPRALGQVLAAERGWVGAEWVALDRLWSKESGWQMSDPNSLGCDGIPQACPASKMSKFGDWRRSAMAQIKWGLWYIATRYGRPSSAWAHSVATDPGGWY